MSNYYGTPVSIIIPTYNRSKRLVQTINSFQNQTYENWELLVIDDFSTDDTKKVISQLLKTDRRIKYFVNERAKGAQGARNTGILRSTFDWIVLFDSDDVVYPFFLSSLIHLIENENEIVYCYGNLVNINSGETISLKWGGNGNIEKNLLLGKSYITFDNALIPKKALYNIGLLDEDCPSYQEFDTHIRLSKDYNYRLCPTVLFDYRVGGQDTISINQNKNYYGYTWVFLKHLKHWKVVVGRKEFMRKARYCFRYTPDIQQKKQLLKKIPLLFFQVPLITVIDTYRRFISHFKS